MRRSAAVFAAATVLACFACGGSSAMPSIDDLESDPLLATIIPGTSNVRVESRRAGDDPSLTVLMDVIGEWNAVSAAIAGAAIGSGWQIESINCVGTGNDVIAKKSMRGEWVLLEAGAGTRGAGLILRLDPAGEGPGPFTVGGRCPDLLVAKASGG